MLRNFNKKSLKFWVPTGVVLIVAIILAANPLRYPEETIEARLFTEIPLGASKEMVEAHIQSEEWEIIFNGEKIAFPCLRSSSIQEIPTKTIMVKMGDYLGFPFILPIRVHVFAFWNFNEESELIEICVSKDISSL